MASETKACLTLPPVTTTDYEAKGTYDQVGDLKAYITGDQSSTKGIIDVYDAFGFTSQTFQGADRLAASLKAMVVIPDFFKANPAQQAWFPPDTDEKKDLVGKFRAQMHAPDNYSMLMASVADAKAKWPLVEAWAIMGLCWGGKLAALASGVDSAFKASAQAHPAKLAKEDAEAMTIPHLCLPSKDEPSDAVKSYVDIFNNQKKVGQVELYSTMFHGWMGARANLKDEENAKEFERGYNQIASFFAQHL